MIGLQSMMIVSNFLVHWKLPKLREEQAQNASTRRYNVCVRLE